MSSNPLKAGQAPGLSSVSNRPSSRFSLQTITSYSSFLPFGQVRSTLQRISPEDGLVIIDIVNLPRVDDSPKGEEDKLLFPLKLDI